MTRSEKSLLGQLTRAHRLTRRERRVCRRLANLYGLDGRSGPATSPAVLFFRPGYWEVFARDARDGADGFTTEEVESLALKIFSGDSSRPAPAAIPDAEDLPRDWAAREAYRAAASS